MAAESPPTCINSADPRTTSSAAAVMISRARTLASNRNSGLRRKRPATIRMAMEPSAKAIGCHLRPASDWIVGLRNATTASNGTIAKSSSKRIDTIFCPAGVDVSPRSSITCSTTAVDVMTKPIAATNATAGVKP